MSRIATANTHPADKSTLIIHVPYDADRELMRGFEAATRAATSGHYLVSVEQLTSLTRWLGRAGVRVVDERNTGRTPTPTPRERDLAAGVAYAEWAARHPDEADAYQAAKTLLQRRPGSQPATLGGVQADVEPWVREPDDPDGPGDPWEDV